MFYWFVEAAAGNVPDATWTYIGRFFLTWVYTTQMALSENIVHCPISWLESLLIVISCHFTEIPIWGIRYMDVYGITVSV